MTSYGELPIMLSVPQLATALGISRSGAYALVRSAGFPALKIGSRIVIPKDELLAWIHERCLSNSLDNPQLLHQAQTGKVLVFLFPLPTLFIY